MTAKRWWVPFLVGVLVAVLVAVLVGPAAVTAAEPRVTTRSIMIPASAFVPIDDSTGYRNEGFYLASEDAYGNFQATLAFPVPVVYIKKITLYAVDSTAAGNVCVYLMRWAPATLSFMNLGGACTTGATGTTLQVVSTTSIDPRRVSTATQGAYLRLSMYPSQNLNGVKITYSYGA